ncbi:nicotianamine synthase1 [Cladochytrium replicatum]|nr:nicotianamine synthase1 [Cladochytrium replicatum]
MAEHTDQWTDVTVLVDKILSLHNRISTLPSLAPSPTVDAVFTELVAACVPPSKVDVTKLSPPLLKVREELIRLCSSAEENLEAHFADKLAEFDNPLDHLQRFPYYTNYVKLAELEYTLLANHLPDLSIPERVAFVGSGPLPFSSLVLASHHLPDTLFDNYDLNEKANEQAKKLVRADKSLEARMSFRTADVAQLTATDLATYDVVFLAALVGMTAEEKAQIIAHLGRNMADGAGLVVRSAHGARGFLYPIVDPANVVRGGFEILSVYHPDDEVINSVIIARKQSTRNRWLSYLVHVDLVRGY